MKKGKRRRGGRRKGILKSSSHNSTKLCWGWSLEQMGKEKLDVLCGCGRKMNCCPYLKKKKKVLSGAQTQFSSPWKVFLGALCSEAPEARADPSRMGEKTDPISLLIWVQLRGDN